MLTNLTGNVMATMTTWEWLTTTSLNSFNVIHTFLTKITKLFIPSMKKENNLCDTIVDIKIYPVESHNYNSKPS